MDARPFRSVNELTNVSGITQAKLATLKPLVRVKATRTAAEAGKPVPEQRSTVRSSSPTGVGKPAPAEKGSASVGTSRSKSELGRKIDLNTATKEELESLPGIGPVRAQAIIDGRPYSKPEDVMKVNGIKEGIYSEIKDQVTVK